MAAPAREVVEMYMSITGASVPVALRMLEQYGGDLTRAVNAHFNGYPAEMYQDSAEDQMIQAAIEASLQEAYSMPGRKEEPVLKEDEDLCHATAQSLKIGEPEKANMKHEVKDKDPELGTPAAGDRAEDMKEGSNKESQIRLGTGADSLPQEPASDDENAINLVVRMPDGTQHGRRFLKTDKLQSLFAFIDNGGLVVPGASYKLVASCARRHLTADACSKTFGELGLTSEHEVLFLEII